MGAKKLKRIYIGFVVFKSNKTELVSCSNKSRQKAGELLDDWITKNTAEGELKEQGVLEVVNSDYIDIGNTA